MNSGSDDKLFLVRYAFSIILFATFFAAALFLSSGSLYWVMGWGYIGLVVASQGLVAVVLAVKNPELLNERAQPGKRNLDRVLAGVMAVYGPIGICIVSGLNHRYGWSPSVSLEVQLIAMGVAAIGALMTVWAMVTNKYFYSVLRIEIEMGHTVYTSGPYERIRHPGYTGALIFSCATPFMLGSVWAFIPAAATVFAIVVRTALEDSMLMSGLDGYKDYTSKVRYRLLPGVW